MPWILIAAFVSLSLFYYANQKSAIRANDRRRRLDERRQQLLQSILQKDNTKSTENDITKQ